MHERLRPLHVYTAWEGTRRKQFTTVPDQRGFDRPTCRTTSDREKHTDNTKAGPRLMKQNSCANLSEQQRSHVQTFFLGADASWGACKHRSTCARNPSARAFSQLGLSRPEYQTSGEQTTNEHALGLFPAPTSANHRAAWPCQFLASEWHRQEPEITAAARAPSRDIHQQAERATREHCKSYRCCRCFFFKKKTCYYWLRALPGVFD